MRMRFRFLLLLLVSVLVVSCASTKERREREAAALRTFLSNPPPALAYDSDDEVIRQTSYQLAVFAQNEVMCFRCYQTAVDNSRLYKAYWHNIHACMEATGKSEEEAGAIVLKRFQEEQPEVWPDLKEAIVANMAVDEAAYAAGVAAFCKPFTQTKGVLSAFGLGALNALGNMAQGQQNYAFYNDLKQRAGLAATEDCDALDEALDAVLYGKQVTTQAAERFRRQIAHRLNGDFARILETAQPSYRIVSFADLEKVIAEVGPAMELQKRICNLSIILMDVAREFVKEASYEVEEKLTHKDGTYKYDKNGNIKTVVKTQYRQRSLPPELVDGLVAIRVMETQLAIVQQCADFAEKMEDSKEEADENADDIR